MTSPPRSRALGVAIVAGAVLLAMGAWAERGGFVGLVALATYVPLVVAWLRRPEESKAWSRDHPWLDSLLIVPLAFVLVAVLDDIPLVTCALIAAGLWLLVLLLVARRVRRRAAAT